MNVDAFRDNKNSKDGHTHPRSIDPTWRRCATLLHRSSPNPQWSSPICHPSPTSSRPSFWWGEHCVNETENRTS